MSVHLYSVLPGRAGAPALPVHEAGVDGYGCGWFFFFFLYMVHGGNVHN